MSKIVFSSSVIGSVEDFRSIFTPNSSDRLLLCYESTSDDVTITDLVNFENSVRTAVESHGTKVQLHLWECSSEAFLPAKQQLGKEAGTPLLLVIYRQTIEDTLRQSISDMTHNVPHLCERLASYQRGGKVGVISYSSLLVSNPTPQSSPEITEGETREGEEAGELRLSVDVARLLGLGQRMMSRGQAGYAGRCFQRALDTLDTLAPTAGLALDHSTALCLAWATLARIVQGDSAEREIQRLRHARYTDMVEQPGSDPARAIAIHQMTTAAPYTWRSETCSQRRLRELLAANPEQNEHRCALVITLFLAGDMEHCLTEAVKLRVLNVPFGTTAIAAISKFLGNDHILVKALQ